MRPRAIPKTLQESVGQLPRCSSRRSRHQTELEALANGFRLDFRSMRGSSEVRFALVFTGFCRCRTLCAWSVRRIEKLRKNSRLELQNQGSGRPRGAQRSKFERKNGQLACKYTLEVFSGSRKILSLRERGPFERERARAPTSSQDAREAQSPRSDLR